MTIDDFEQRRPRLIALATRMLGSAADAQDAVQEAWLRADRADTSNVANLDGWLTTVVSRICLDMVRARRDTDVIDEVDPPAGAPAPDELAALADSVGDALGAVLESLGPAERVAFVLHDVFAVPFDDVARVVGKSPAATRQLTSRARRRVSGGERTPEPAASSAVSAFLAASRDGDFTGLVELLDPDAVFRTYRDDAEPEIVTGATPIAEAFMGRAKAAVTALIDGVVGVAVRIDGRLILVMDVAFSPAGQIAAVDVTLRAEELDVVEVAAV